MAETYYKVLRRDIDGTLRSAHGGDAVWPEPKRIGFAVYEPGNPVMAHAAPSICEAGVHLTTDPLQWLTVMPAECYVAEPIGPVRGRRDDKVVFDGARLLEPVEIPYWWREVEAFVASIPDTPWMQRVAPPLPEWNMYASRAASWTASWTASWNASWTASWNASSNASRAASWAASRAASWTASWDASWTASRAASRDASRDAQLLVSCLCAGGLIDTKALAHARARWEVWQRGYGLLCDVDGVLYVYERVA